MDPFNPHRLRDIYNDFAAGYDGSRDHFDNAAQLTMLAGRIPGSADVLDVGCGSGHPVLRFFADKGCQVTGTDLSPEMLILASKHVPEARLLEMDSAALRFPEGSFDLITSFYSLFHLEMDKQCQAFACFRQLLRSDGFAYFTLASREYTGMAEFSGTKEFAGVELPYSHVTPEAYRDMLHESGLFVVSMEHLEIGGETMLWVLVQKECI